MGRRGEEEKGRRGDGEKRFNAAKPQFGRTARPQDNLKT
jgi:hypothetical protein